MQKRFLFVVRIDFDILVGDLLFFECHPGTLDEATKVRLSAIHSREMLVHGYGKDQMIWIVCFRGQEFLSVVALHEDIRAEPSRIELQWLILGVSCDDFGCWTCCMRMGVCVWM